MQIITDQFHTLENQKVTGVSLPFENTISQLGKYAGVEIVSGETEGYDATIRTEAESVVLSASYGTNIGILRGHRYSGAELAGSIMIETARGRQQSN